MEIDNTFLSPTASNKAISNFKKIIKKIPFLFSVLSKINQNEIRYGLYAGSHVSILTSNRNPTDVDFLVSDQDAQKLKDIFPFAKTSDFGNGLFMYIGKHEEIEFVSFSDISHFASHYSFRLTDLCWRHTNTLKAKDFSVRLLNVVDTLLLKAILQRGKEEGKHDLKDIEALLKYCRIDKNYLLKRLAEVGSDDRLIHLLKKYDLIK